ncbi:DUF4145 domain-containing protein [Aquabacterium fontiphilum]|uniref:DUF4145 domain-containing protein n=1 Tax=Aquabacterium fontiphilum TaxID=450365 RepID=UPI001377F67C|nr:DUF4145 domain-containing protein [Aquabacterium fontiphilum]NBD21452.1 DUF4145 domain-containing protein [Aquabacterium fontiphilum]
MSVPDLCPRCHHRIHPKVVTASSISDRSVSQAIFKCTNQKCQELFIATYVFNAKVGSGGRQYELRAVAPFSAQPADFPETVQCLSPTFVEIYNQVIAAESRSLDQLVGIGLRKALEFLVKDFASAINPDKAEQIKASMLAPCITQFIDDINIKECAKRAAWLGNDETHYVRKWESKDVSDLKLLVRLTVNWIDSFLLTQKYIEEMNAGAPSK